MSISSGPAGLDCHSCGQTADAEGSYGAMPRLGMGVQTTIHVNGLAGGVIAGLGAQID